MVVNATKTIVSDFSSEGDEVMLTCDNLFETVGKQTAKQIRNLRVFILTLCNLRNMIKL